MEKIQHGARWWKFDFHTHTTMSQVYDINKEEYKDDWKEPDVTLEEWLQALIDKGIECVAVTDHNAVEAIDELNSMCNMEEGKFYRKIWIFPGIELTVNSKHFLVIFDVGTNANKIKDFLVVAFNEKYHSKPTWQATKTVLECAKKAKEAGALFIPAHCNQGRGVFFVDETKTMAGSVPAAYSDVFLQELISALEVTDIEAQTNLKRNCFAKAQELPHILGSDAHRLSELGAAYTWVKLGQTPSLASLKLALAESQTRIVPRNSQETNPPVLPPRLWIKSLKIENYQFSGSGGEKTWHFSPWLTTIIGSRGTGKSSVLRALGKTVTGTLEALYEQKNFLKQGSKITVQVDEFANNLYLTVSADSSCELRNGDKPLSLDYLNERILYFGQKYLFEIADDPARRWQFFRARFSDSSFDEVIAQLVDKIVKMKKSVHDLSEKKKTLLNLEESLALAKKRASQEVDAKIIELFNRLQYDLDWHKHYIYSFGVWIGDGARIKEIANVIAPFPNFERAIDLKHSIQLQALTKAYDDLKKALQGIDSLFNTLDDSWLTLKKNLEVELEALTKTHSEVSLKASTAKGILDSMKELNEKIERCKEEIKLLEKAPEQLEELTRKYKEVLQERAKLRQSWIDKTNKTLELRDVRIQLRRFANAEDMKRSFLSLFTGASSYIDFVDNLVGIILKSSSTQNAYIQAVDQLILVKETELFAVDVNGEIIELNGWVRKALVGAELHSLYSIRYRLPEDQIFLQRIGADTGIPFEDASPGQRATILLSIILSEGDEPILIDQPEDDLDNRMIYETVVASLKEQKTKRQIILVTHNPNIVVNGDAEQVIALEAEKGETKISEGSIDETCTRTHICNVLEGGKEALIKRFERVLHLV